MDSVDTNDAASVDGDLNVIKVCIYTASDIVVGVCACNVGCII